MPLETFGDVSGRPVVLAASETVGEQCDSTDFALRTIQKRGQLLALGIPKIKSFGRHKRLLRSFGRGMVCSDGSLTDGLVASTNSDGNLHNASADLASVKTNTRGSALSPEFPHSGIKALERQWIHPPAEKLAHHADRTR